MKHYTLNGEIVEFQSEKELQEIREFNQRLEHEKQLKQDMESRIVRCKCKTHGCSHFGSGNCRVSNEPCVMDHHCYHYVCCPFLKSERGKELLTIYMKSRGLDINGNRLIDKI